MSKETLQRWGQTCQDVGDRWFDQTMQGPPGPYSREVLQSYKSIPGALLAEFGRGMKSLGRGVGRLRRAYSKGNGLGNGS